MFETRYGKPKGFETHRCGKHTGNFEVQSIFKRHVATKSGGNKWFKRMSTVQKDGLTHISMKRSPESLTVENPQLHYMLRLCQDETNWTKAAEWLQKLEDLHRGHPEEKEGMMEWEYDSLGELAVIVTFIQDLSSLEKLPPVNQKKREQAFLSGYLALENELRNLKSGIDLGDFAIPIDNLLEPGMAVGALTTLDAYILEKTGSKLGFLYQDMIDDCAATVQKRYEQQKAKAANTKAEYKTPIAPETPERIIHQRRQKEKTRPAHSSVFEIMPQAKTSPSSAKETSQTQETFKVKPSTFAIFSSLLCRSAESRGSVTWNAFTAAMADLGFSVIPKLGSVYTFVRPEKFAVQRDLTLHRPHQSTIEGWRLLVVSRRLKRVYGWDESTFVSS